MADQFTRRSSKLLPTQLVEDWPRDYKADYKHPTHQAQLDEALREPLARVARWMNGDVEDWAGMLFYGEPGFGKTGVALACLLHAARHGFFTRFVTAERVVAKRASTTFNWKEGTTEEALLDEFLAPDLLLVDDVATREYTAPGRALLFDITRERKSLLRPTLMTTNIKLGSLKFTDPEAQKKEDAESAQGRFLFSAALDARVLSSYTGQAFNAGKWKGAGQTKAVSLRGRG